MINLERIKNVENLLDIQKTLNDYLSNQNVPNAYVELGQTLADYEADKKEVIKLLSKVDIRLKKLTKLKSEKSLS
jgi:hypothetical protein